MGSGGHDYQQTRSERRHLDHSYAVNTHTHTHAHAHTHTRTRTRTHQQQ